MNKDEQSILSRMIEIYKPDGYDWMGTKEKKNNPFTYHHIVKRKNGETTVENGAILTKKSHQLLNKLQARNEDLFDSWQWLFMEINHSNNPPSTALLEEIRDLRKQTKEFIYGEPRQLKL